MKNLLLFILMIIPVLLSAQTPVPPGPVSGTWDIGGSPYMVNGEIYLDNPDTLLIEPGVKVRFTGWYKFIVYGSLIAEGTESEQILFTADDTNMRWFGIRFINATGTSVLDHCIVEYGLSKLGGGWPDNDYFGGGVLLHNSASASISITNSTIRDNIAEIGGGIQITGTYPIIDNCEISGNSAQIGGGVDAMVMSSTSSATIKNSTITYNHSDKSGGGISAGWDSNIELLNNSIIHNNSSNNSSGIRVYHPKILVVTGNTIAHNSCLNKGGGVRLTQAGDNVTFADNTIVFNHADVDGGGLMIDTGYISTHVSDILYFNTPEQVYLSNSTSRPFFSYCDVEGGCTGFNGSGANNFPCSTNFVNCIDTDPLFADAANDDFSLTWVNYPEPDNTRSECIDSGCPGVPDADGTCNDIGAYFFFQQIDIPDVQPPLSVSQTSFIAKWEEAYGALYYLLDVAEDYTFTTFVLENDSVDGTERLVEGLEFGKVYHYRVRAANTAVTSDYSAIMGNPVDIPEIQSNVLKLYYSEGTIIINITDGSVKTGEVHVYNLAGKLLIQGGLVSGCNVIDPVVSNQVVILRVVINDNIYHRKLYVH